MSRPNSNVLELEAEYLMAKINLALQEHAKTEPTPPLKPPVDDDRPETATRQEVKIKYDTEDVVSETDQTPREDAETTSPVAGPSGLITITQEDETDLETKEWEDDLPDGRGPTPMHLPSPATLCWRCGQPGHRRDHCCSLCGRLDTLSRECKCQFTMNVIRKLYVIPKVKLRVVICTCSQPNVKIAFTYKLRSPVKFA